MTEHRLALLFSGEGTNAEVLAKTFHNQTFQNAKTTVALSLTNNKDAGGIAKLANLGITTTVIDHKLYASREAFDTELLKQIKTHGVTLTLLAGFMRILTPIFTDHVVALNIHPSLLPLHKGANAMEASYRDSAAIAGVTVHYVSSDLDSGKIMMQAQLDKKSGETFDTFQSRIHALEYDIYPKSVKKILNIK